MAVCVWRCRASTPDHPGRAIVEWTALQLGIETPPDAPYVEQLAAYVRACRVATIAGRVAADAPRVHVLDGLQVFSSEVRDRAEERLADIARATGFVGVIVTELKSGSLESDIPRDTARDVSGSIELRYAEEDVDCCAIVAAPRRGMRNEFVCCPAVDGLAALFSGGRADEALRQFVAYVDELAGEPRPRPRRLPDDPFAEL